MKIVGSIFLIFTIVYTTIGVHINTHRCETKNTTSYSILERVNCCSKKTTSCQMHQSLNDCCTDNVDLVHLGSDIHFSPDVVTPNQALISYYFTSYNLDLTLIGNHQNNRTKGRAPPLLKQRKNIQAFFQTYII